MISMSKTIHILKIVSFSTLGSVVILIGQDNTAALIPLEVRGRPKGTPFAINTIMVWALDDTYCCCSLPIPMTIASGGSQMFPLVVHQPDSLASSAVTPAGSVQG